MFGFQRLDVYRKSLELFHSVEMLSRQLKGKTSYSLLDQLHRACLSVPLNIAEGNGRWSKKEKIQFLRVARASLFEMVPIFEILSMGGQISLEEFQKFHSELDTISRMLTGLANSIQRADLSE